MEKKLSKNILKNTLCFALFLLKTFTGMATKEGEQQLKEYTIQECKHLGLSPISLEDGNLIMPKHDGKNYLVALENSDATTEKMNADDVHALVQKLRDAGKVVHDILNVRLVSDLPVVVQQEMNGVLYEFVLNKLVFTPTGNKLSIVAMISLPNGAFYAFEGENVKFTGKGGIESGSLSLLLDNNPTLTDRQLGNKVNLQLTGGGFTYGCNGFEDFSLFGNVIFDRSLIVPESTSTGDVIEGNVKSSFRIEHAKDFNDLIIKISVQPFQMPNMKGFGFQVSDAIIDLSEKSNASGFKLPKDYLPSVGGELWKGVAIGNIEVRFPKTFKNRTSKQRIQAGVNALLIDKYGLSGEFYGKNILTIKDGDLNGWDYSIEDASVILVKNQVKAGSLGGKLRVSISDENRLLGYNALIDPTKDYYNFSVRVIDSLEFSFLKASKVLLKPASYISLKLKDGEFSASAMLHGKLNINANEVKLEEFTFENLFISTAAPYLSIGSFSGGGSGTEYRMGGFPISIISPKIGVLDNVANIEFGVKVNLDDMGISATGGFLIQGAFVSENNRHFWKNKSFELKKLAVEADLNVGQFKGTVEFFKDDAIYGKGFYGEMAMTLNLDSPVSVKAAAVFGKKEDRYWFVDGELSSGGGMGGISINLLSGCLYKHMKAVPGQNGPKSVTGVVYAPDFGVNWGGRFGIGFSVGSGDAFAGMAALEIETRLDGSVNKLGFIGMVAIAGAGTMINPEGVKQKYYMLCNDAAINFAGGVTSKLDSDPNGGETKGVAQKFEIPGNLNGFMASVTLKFNFDERSFYGKVGANVSVAGKLQIQGVGAFLFAPNTWFIHIGEPPLSDRVMVKLPALPQIDGYIMLGYGIPELPNPEPNIFVKYPNSANGKRGLNTNQAALGRGIAFGAALSLADGGDYKVISWNVGVRAGLDVMLMKAPDGAYCVGRQGQGVGIDGWRAAAQVYVIGWFKAGAFGMDVLSLELGALLKGAAPNPTYGEGQVAVSFKILFKRFNFDVGFSVGDDCVLVGGSEQTSEDELVYKVYPGNGVTVTKDVIPNFTSTEKLNSEINLPQLEGKFRVSVTDYRLNSQFGDVRGNKALDPSDPTKFVFTPTEPMPCFTNITMVEKLQVQKLENGNWQPFYMEGKAMGQTKLTSFMISMTRQDLNDFVDNSGDKAHETAQGIGERAKNQGEAILNHADSTIKIIEGGVDKLKEQFVKNCKNCTPEGKQKVIDIGNELGNNIAHEDSVAKAKIADIVKKSLSDAYEVTKSAGEQVDKNVKEAKAQMKNDSTQAVLRIKEQASFTYNKYASLCQNEQYSVSSKLMYNNNNYNNNNGYSGGYSPPIDYAAEANAKCNSWFAQSRNEIAEMTTRLTNNALTHSSGVMIDVVKQNDAIMAQAKIDCDKIMNDAKNASDDVLNELVNKCKSLMLEAEQKCEKIQGYQYTIDMTGFINDLFKNTKLEPLAPPVTNPVVPTNPVVTIPSVTTNPEPNEPRVRKNKSEFDTGLNDDGNPSISPVTTPNINVPVTNPVTFTDEVPNTGSKKRKFEIDDSKPANSYDPQYDAIAREEQARIQAAAERLEAEQRALAAAKAEEDARIIAIAKKAEEDAAMEARRRLEEEYAAETARIAIEQANADNLRRLEFERNEEERISATRRRRQKEQEDEDAENARIAYLKIIADAQAAADAKAAADAQAAIDFQNALDAQRESERYAADRRREKSYTEEQYQTFQVESNNDNFPIGQDNGRIFEYGRGRFELE